MPITSVGVPSEWSAAPGLRGEELSVLLGLGKDIFERDLLTVKVIYVPVTAATRDCPQTAR